LAEILKKHYFAKERIRIRSIGIQTVRKERVWIAVQEKDNFQGGKYIHTCICVCVLYTVQPHLHSGKTFILQKKLHAETELLSDHIHQHMQTTELCICYK
jgi:hypothetical protein